MDRGSGPVDGTAGARGCRLGNSARYPWGGRALGGQVLTPSVRDRLSEGLVIDVELRIGPFDWIEWLVDFLATISVPHTELLLMDDPYVHQSQFSYYRGVFRFTVR